MPSTSTSGPHQRHPDLVGQRKQLVEPVVGQLQHAQGLLLVEAFAALQHLLAGQREDVGHPILLLRRLERRSG